MHRSVSRLRLTDACGSRAGRNVVMPVVMIRGELTNQAKKITKTTKKAIKIKDKSFKICI